MARYKNPPESVEDIDLDEAARRALDNSQDTWIDRYYVALDFRLPDGHRLIGMPLTVGYADRSVVEAELDRLKPEYPHAYMAKFSMDPDYCTPDGENIFKGELYRGRSERSVRHTC